MERGILIAETRHGFVCANAGVDASNVAPGFVTVLPRRPGCLGRPPAGGAQHGVRLSGRGDRVGYVRPRRGAKASSTSRSASPDLRPLVDYRGSADTYGRPLTSTVIALADELAGAAEIVTRKSAGTPVAIVRGAAEWAGEGNGRMLVRDASRDLFR